MKRDLMLALPGVFMLLLILVPSVVYQMALTYRWPTLWLVALLAVLMFPVGFGLVMALMWLAQHHD